MKEVSHGLPQFIADAQGRPVGSLERRQCLDQAYDQILLTRRKSEPRYRDILLEIIQLYVAEIAQASADNLERLYLLSKLCGLISDAQNLEKVQTLTAYKNAIDVAQQILLEETPKIQQQLVSITAGQCTVSYPQSAINRLLNHVALIPPLRSTHAYEVLFSQVLRLQIAATCQFPADPKNETLAYQRQEQFNKLYRLVNKSNKLIGRVEWQSMPWYEESVLEIWEDCYLHLEQYEPELEQLRRKFLDFCCCSSGNLNLQMFTPLENIVASSGWIWKGQVIQKCWENLCQTTNRRNPYLEQVMGWVSNLDETHRTQKSRQRILIWLSVITWKPDEFQPALKQFTTWLGDRLWAKLQRDKYRFITRAKQEVAFPIQEDEVNALKNPLLSWEYEPNRSEARERWDRVLSWAEANPGGLLSKVLFRKREDVTAQVIIIRRLQSPPVEWKDIAEEFNLTPYKKMIPRLSEFFKRKCYPLIQQYAKEIGIY